MEEEKTTIPIKRQYKMNPQVFKAASSGDSSFFQNLTGSDPNSSTFLQVTIQENTVLHVALQFKKYGAAEKIVNLSPSLVYETNSKGNTPLHVAARIGDSSMVKLLIDQAKKQDVEIGGRQQLLSMVNLDKDTALHVAVRYGNSEIVKELINEKDPAKLAKEVNNAGESALFLAVDRQDYDMASHILDNTPDCSYAGRHGMNVLHALVIHTSIYCNKESSFQQLREIESDENGNYKFLRETFAWVNWVINMLFLIPLPELLDDTPKKEDRKRFYPVGNIPTALVEKVIEKWPSTIEQGDERGWTPLHIAAHMGNEEFVKLLLEKNNSLACLRNDEGLSALHIAAKKCNNGVMDILMTACPDIYELLDNKGRNVLHAAAESRTRAAFLFFDGRPEFEILINEQDEQGNTPSNLAAINGHTSMAQRLGEYREYTDVLNATNKDGFTIMDVDNVLSTRKIAKELWEMGARLSLRGALLKMGIQKDKGDGNGNGNGEGRSKSDFMKQRNETTLVVAALIATVTFTASFTVPGGYKSQDGVDEGSALLSKKKSFQMFLIANSAAFGLSLASVFSHFTASKMILDFILHRKKFVARAPDSTSYSTFAMLLAFILGTYTVVPHNMGITIAVIVCWCFLGSYIISLLHILNRNLSPLVSSSIKKKKEEEKKNHSPNQKQNKEEQEKNHSPNQKQNKEEQEKNHSTIQKQNKEEVNKKNSTTFQSESDMSTMEQEK